MNLSINSKQGFLIAAAFILVVHFFYYPKWQQSYTEATLSWDVSGYYMYLPALFIHKDLKGCEFVDEVLEKYQPTPNFQQGFFHEESGNCVMKYPAGMALMYMPFFWIAHGWASISAAYPADGFSFPYQLLISLGTLIFALLGLYYIRKSLLVYFDDSAVGWALLLMVFGSNYLNYSAIDGAMTHNFLFTLYAILIWQTIRFYRKPDFIGGAIIGAIVGLMALTRPTEIIAVIIPILWGVNLFSLSSLKNRFNLILQKSGIFLTAVVSCGMVGSIQLIYWKYVSGDWLVYSYEDQGFSWLKPRIWKGFFSHKAGWLMYSPLMLISLFGFYYLWKKRADLFGSAFLFFLVFIYIAFSWDIWWYGGSLGQRTMVQAYAVLMFPMAAFLTYMMKWDLWKKLIVGALIALGVYVNLWFTHQAHKGGWFFTEQMNKEYYWATVGRWNISPEVIKYLDTDELFRGEIGKTDTLYNSSFEWNHLPGRQSAHLYPEVTDFEYPAWLRISANWRIGEKEWNFWDQTQLTGRFMKNGEVVKSRFFRLHRFLDPHSEKEIYLDIQFPDEEFDRIEVTVLNEFTPQFIEYSGLKVFAFMEK